MIMHELLTGDATPNIIDGSSSILPNVGGAALALLVEEQPVAEVTLGWSGTQHQDGAGGWWDEN